MLIYCLTATGLRHLLRRLDELLTYHELLLNISKTKIVIFKADLRNVSNLLFTINGIAIEIVSEYKYLGCILKNNLCEIPDLDRILKSFNKSVGMFVRKFGNIDFQIKLQLFESLCMSFYGIELFMKKKNATAALRKLGVAYHYGLKRLLGFPKYESNHYTCEVLHKLTFNHFLNFKALKFLFWMNSYSSPCFNILKVYFIKFSYFKNFISEIFYKIYDIPFILDNDIQAIYSRITFIQQREPSSWNV